eukprot:gene6146-12451_t
MQGALIVLKLFNPIAFFAIFLLFQNSTCFSLSMTTRNPQSGNIFSDVQPGLLLTEENISPILTSSSGLRIFRIISTGQTTSRDDWYDQDDNEWVLLIQGNATLLFENGEENIVLSISENPPAVWLAIHHDGDIGSCTSLPPILSIPNSVNHET